MGLDLVELALSVEDEFDIAIPDAILETIITPNDYADYIFEEYQKKDALKCSSQVGFYKIRKLFIEEFNCKREYLKPNTKLEDIFKENIKENWMRLDQLLNGKLGSYFSNITSVYLFLSFYLSMIFGIVFNSSLFLFFLFWIILFIGFRYFFAFKIPNPRNKLSLLIKFVDESNARSKYNDRDDILKKIIEITIYELNISPSEIFPNSKYVEDLRAD